MKQSFDKSLCKFMRVMEIKANPRVFIFLSILPETSVFWHHQHLESEDQFNAGVSGLKELYGRTGKKLKSLEKSEQIWRCSCEHLEMMAALQWFFSYWPLWPNICGFHKTTQQVYWRKVRLFFSCLVRTLLKQIKQTY